MIEDLANALTAGGRTMPNLLLCSFNVERTNDWFIAGDGPAAFRPAFPLPLAHLQVVLHLG